MGIVDILCPIVPGSTNIVGPYLRELLLAKWHCLICMKMNLRLKPQAAQAQVVRKARKSLCGNATTTF